MNQSEKGSRPSKFKIILTDPDDLILQSRAASYAIKNCEWKGNDFIVVEFENGKLYAVKFNKKSVTVWTQK